MKKILSKALGWMRSIDPGFRELVYRVSVPLMPLLVYLGAVASTAQGELWLALVQALVGVGAGGLAWANTETSWRRWLYGVATSLSAILVALNVFDDAVAPLILTVVQAVLSSSVAATSAQRLAMEKVREDAHGA